ncbi:MAG: GNAT family N-acetyltransferase [Devosiaceae bacterium]
MRTLSRSSVADFGHSLGFEDIEEALQSDTLQPDANASITCFSSFEDVEGLWRTFEQSASGSVYQHYDWCKIWFDVVSSQHDIIPLIVVWSIDTRTALLLPLYVSRGPLGTKVARLMGDDHANIRVPFITSFAPDRLRMIQAGNAGAVMPAIAKAIRNDGHADVLVLTDMPKNLDGETNVLVSSACTASEVTLFSGELSSDFEALQARRRPGRSQRKMRRYLKKIQEIGEPEFVRIDDPTMLDNVLDAFFEQKGARLNQAGESSAFDEDINRKILRKLAHASLKSGNKTLEFYAFIVNGQPIAIAGGGHHKDRFSMGINSMTDDPQFAAHSPGRLSLNCIIELFCSQGLELFDLGLGENAYKHMWCDPVKLYDAQVALSWKGKVYGALSSLKRGMLNYIRRSPKALKLAKRARFALQQLGARHT